MADIMDSRKRSLLMGRIRAANTTPELAIRRALFALGYRFRVHGTKLPGRPDVVFGPARVAVFVHGCFWHGCPEHYQAPRSRADFWRKKLQANKARDKRVRRELPAMGWTVIELWEHEVDVSPLSCAQRVARAVDASRARLEPRVRQPRQAEAGPRSRFG